MSDDSSGDNENKICWCSCGCACIDDENTPCGRLRTNGLCSDCDNGKHEIPPPGTAPSIFDLVRAHLSVINDYVNYLEKEKLYGPEQPMDDKSTLLGTKKEHNK